MNYEGKIFELFGYYDKVSDVNKNVSGKGTYERYNEVVGLDIDAHIVPLIENAVANLSSPSADYGAMVAHFEDQLGVDFRVFSEIEWRVRVSKHFSRWVRLKGTRAGLKAMLNFIGISLADIVVYGFAHGFDSVVTLDDSDRVFDKKCYGCNEYDVQVNGSYEMTAELMQAIRSIIAYNEPINARLRTVVYNGTAGSSGFSTGFSVGFS